MVLTDSPPVPAGTGVPGAAGPSRPALALAAAVLGSGALFVPGLAVQLAGDHTGLAWLVQLVLAVPFVFALARAGQRRPAGSATDLVGMVFGAQWRAAMKGWYLVGTTAGQGVVALVAGGYAAIAVGRPGSVLAPLTALAVLLAGGGAAARGWGGGGRPFGLALRCGLALVLVGAAARALLGGHTAGPVAGSAAPAAGASQAGLPEVGQAAFVLLFAAVGIESAVRAGSGGRRQPATGTAPAELAGASADPSAVAGAGTTGGPRPVVTPMLAGLAIAAAGYALAALPTALSGAGADPAAGRASGLTELGLPAFTGSPTGQLLAGLAAGVAAGYCARTVALTSRLAPRLPGRPRWGSPAVVVLGASAGVALVTTGRLSSVSVLAVPNSMALAVFVTTAAAAAVSTAGAARWAAGAALAGYTALGPFAGLALLWPLAVLVAGTLVVSSGPTGGGRRAAC